MKITIEGTPKEVKELLQANDNSKEQMIDIDPNRISHLLSAAIRDIPQADLKK